MGRSLALCVMFAFIAAGQTIVATPAGLAFTYTADSEILPAPQTLQITSTGASIPFVVSVGAGALGQDPVYVSVTPTSGVTPATLTVTMTSVILPYGYGQYTNLIDIGNPNSPATGGVQIYVATDVTLPPPPTVNTILNAATLQPGISPEPW